MGKAAFGMGFGSQDFHPEGLGNPGHRLPDITQAQNPHRFLVEHGRDYVFPLFPLLSTEMGK